MLGGALAVETARSTMGIFVSVLWVPGCPSIAGPDLLFAIGFSGTKERGRTRLRRKEVTLRGGRRHSGERVYGLDGSSQRTRALPAVPTIFPRRNFEESRHESSHR